MHATFTGSTRRPRQVNLSGTNKNPWANLPGAPKATQNGGTSHNALAQAQAERIKRAQNRERVIAAQKIQRTWRGYAAQTKQKQKWREEWDRNEATRASVTEQIPYQDPGCVNHAKSYQSEEQLGYQMSLLLMFLDTHVLMDRMRLCFFAQSLRESWQLVEQSRSQKRWTYLLSRFSLAVTKSVRISISSPSPDSHTLKPLLELVMFLVEKSVRLDYTTLFKSLRYSLNHPPTSSTSDVSSLILKVMSTDNDAAYGSFVNEFLPFNNLKSFPQLTEQLRESLSQDLLIRAVLHDCDHTTLAGVPRILANIVYVWRSIDLERVHFTWIAAISLLLSKCANQVAGSYDFEASMSGSQPTGILSTMDDFVCGEIGSLAEETSIRRVMAQFQLVSIDVSEVAKPLANYAVALLRAFPNRSTNIRMWLYRLPPAKDMAGEAPSTIQYLWKAAQSTSVFKTISSSDKDTLSILTEAKPYSDQFSYKPASAQEISAWQEDWRIVLLFLELYTFILKIMDDEEFFALDDSYAFASSASQQFRRGALPMQQIAMLGDFLKSLAFTLYWHAADLAESNEIEEETTIAALFAQRSADQGPRQNSKPVLKTLAGNDVSQAHMKSLVTGLLRMLHERDSRRTFLPENYWLMTKQFDLQSFIPAVVDEEERRHEALMNGVDDDDVEETTGDDISQNDMPESHMLDVNSMFNFRAPHTALSHTTKQNEQLLRQREQARRRRQMQSLNPRLEILRNLPFFIPFETRVQIFRRFVRRDQERRRNGYVEADEWRLSVAATQGRIGGRVAIQDALDRHRASIRRGSVFLDAYEQFDQLGEGLKEPIQISFIDQFGEPEAGIDGGGVTKEFLMSVTSEALDPSGDMAMFEENEQRFLYPSPTIVQKMAYRLKRAGHHVKTEVAGKELGELIRHYEFLGRIIGKCMYEGILIDVNFAGFFLLKWALTGGTTTATNESAFRASINDLRDFDEQLYQGLLKLKNYTGDVEADFGLNFTINDTFDVDGKMVTVTTELERDGANVAITSANRLKYIDRVVRYRLQAQPRSVTNAFLRGLGQIISPMWLAMFNQRELQKLVGGDNLELDIADLRRNTQYSGLYVIGDDGREHPVISMFWKVLKEMDDANRRKVLKFVTSTPRAPLLGFSNLNPKFSIRDSSEDQTRLPSTSTCVNLLKLPRYSDEKTMREKLLYAANSGAGFDLS